ncbi:uncharacterized protein LOC123504866 [Portunus trituberculatus]|uniref:uncharacterized protein LOC123504866 n=1 Tax=Portunus trituberculatus TaxID=210409 RepID=UPI001E1D1D99|nr:uncharacterized protein LOC123504866 [Portunus trituberculatus]
MMGTSDHHVKLSMGREAAAPRTIWLWERADWEALRNNITNTDWDALLRGNAEEKARALTTKLLALQQQHVPSRMYLVRPGDRCRTAAEAKHAAWERLVKEQQGMGHRNAIPPLTRPDGTTAISSEDKASLLAEFFAGKMTVADMGRRPPHLPQETDCAVTDVHVTPGKVEQLLRECVRVLPEGKQVALYMEGGEGGAVHKKNSKSEPNNYRPISLFSVVGKLLEQVVAGVICQHLSEHRLLSDRQFGFRPGRSTADLLTLLSQGWQDALDKGLDILLLALDIAAAFDRVWQAGLVQKLRAKGIQDNLLALLEDYLQGRAFMDFSRSYCRSDSQRAFREINRQLRKVTKWGETWQVGFAPEKTQAMVISRSPAAPPAVSGHLCLGGQILPLQESIKVLGVTVDCGLRFDRHVAAVAHQASLRVSALRRMAGSLDSRAAAAAKQEEQTGVTSLEHQRDVSVLVVQHKARVLEVLHLSSLRIPTRAVQRESRETTSSDMLVYVPQSHSRQHQQSYTATTARLWNAFTAATSDTQTMTLHQVKVAAHRCRKTQTPTLVLC